MSVERDADRGRDGARVDQRKPAERDDAEEQLRRVARRRVVEAELGADRGERLLAGGKMAAHRRAVPAPLSASRSISRTKLGRAARKSK